MWAFRTLLFLRSPSSPPASDDENVSNTARLGHRLRTPSRTQQRWPSPRFSHELPDGQRAVLRLAHHMRRFRVCLYGHQALGAPFDLGIPSTAGRSEPLCDSADAIALA